MDKIKKYVPGILFVLLISYIGIFINSLLKETINLESLTIAIILGMVYNNLIGTQPLLKSGISFSLKKLLKIGIILLGLKLDLKDLFLLGPKVLLMVLVYVPCVLGVTVFLGKLFKVNTKLATLIGVGSSICGASAVVALAPCMDCEEEDSVIAVSIVSFLGAIGVLIYSTLIRGELSLTSTQYGIWSGLTLHGVAHALAAAFAMGNKAGELGTFVKMTRVLMLVPTSILLGVIFNKNHEKKRTTAKFPTYVLYFLAVVILNSFDLVPTGLSKGLLHISSLFILMAMTAMGLMVDFKSILSKGVKGLMVGTVTFIGCSSLALWFIMKML